MKFGVFVNPRHPKIPDWKIEEYIASTGRVCCQKEPDVAIVVGGDGTFGYYGRTLSIPMLFVGVKEAGILGSRAKLAELQYDNLAKALEDIEAGVYSTEKKIMLSVSLNGRSTDILTDVYLERGIFSGCLRYEVSVNSNNKSGSFRDYAIGNGVIVSTSFGSEGYFSYPERLKLGRQAKKNPGRFGDNRIGICHIVPVYFIGGRKNGGNQSRGFMYTIPFRSTVQIKLVRDANARLYGTTVHSRGESVRVDDMITVSPSTRTARIIKLKHKSYELSKLSI